MSKFSLLALTVALLGAPSAIASSTSTVPTPTAAACPLPCASEHDWPCEPCDVPCDAPCAADVSESVATK